MGLIDELRTFIVAISDGSKEAKQNKQVFNKIIDKYRNKAGYCMFCENKLQLEGSPNNKELPMDKES